MFLLFPLSICFKIDLLDLHYTNYIGIVLDCFFILEFILKFLIGYYKDDSIIFNIKKISKEYLTTGFIISLIFAFPFYIIQYSIYQNDSYYNDNPLYLLLNNPFLFFISYGRMIRFVCLYKIGNLIDYFVYSRFEMEEYGDHVKKVVMTKAIIVFFIVFHLLSCMWIYIGKAQGNNDNWLYTFHFVDDDDLTVYFASFYFNLVTILSVGYGDITPKTFDERVYVCILMFFSTLVYSFIVSWMSNVYSESSRKEIIFNEKKKVLNNIISEFSVGSYLEKQLRKSLKFMEKNYTADVNALLNTLPEKLKNIIYKKIYETKTGELEFFKDTSEEFILYCIPRIELVSLKKSESLISQGDIFTEMYMINKGGLNFYLSSAYNNYRINSIGKGYHFGDVNMYLNEQSEYTLKAAYILNEVFTLKKNQYSELKRNFPEIVDLIIKKSIDNFTNLELLRKEACNYFDNYGSLEGFRYIIGTKLKATHFKFMELEEQSDLIKTSSHLNIAKLTNLIKDERRKYSKNNNPFNINVNLEPNKLDIDNIRGTLLNSHSSSSENLTLISKKSQESISSKALDNRVKCYNIVEKVDYIPQFNKFIIKKLFVEDTKNRLRKTNKRLNKFNRMRLDSTIHTRFQKERIQIYAYKKFREDQSDILTLFSSHYAKVDFESIKTPAESNKGRLQLESSFNSNSTFTLERRESEKSLNNSKINIREDNDIQRKSVNLLSYKFHKPSFLIKENNTLNFDQINRKSLLVPKEINNIKEAERTSIIKILESTSPEVNNRRATCQFSPMKIKDNQDQMKEIKKSKYSDLNKKEMMKDFGKRIDKNAFFDNNLNLFGGYLKSFIGTTAGELKTQEEVNNEKAKDPRSNLRHITKAKRKTIVFKKPRIETKYGESYIFHNHEEK